jgi:hypothetical protein
MSNLKPSRTVAATILAVGLTTLVAPSTASAAVGDAALTGTQVSEYEAPCSFSTNVTWQRQSGRLNGYVRVENHLLFAACRKNLVVRLIDDENFEVETRAITVPTACSTLDWTCPSHHDLPIDEVLQVHRRLKPFIDRIEVAVVDRS